MPLFIWVVAIVKFLPPHLQSFFSICIVKNKVSYIVEQAYMRKTIAESVNPLISLKHI